MYNVIKSLDTYCVCFWSSCLSSTSLTSNYFKLHFEWTFFYLKVRESIFLSDIEITFRQFTGISDDRQVSKTSLSTLHSRSHLSRCHLISIQTTVGRCAISAIIPRERDNISRMTSVNSRVITRCVCSHCRRRMRRTRSTRAATLRRTASARPRAA